MITVYDLGPSNFPEDFGCSRYARRVIFALNYKKLPWKRTIVGFEAIESIAKSIGASPTTTKPDGSPKYTVPFIHDSATGRVVSDGMLIAEYLDNAYPDTPKLIPDGTKVLQSDFCDTVSAGYDALRPVLARTHEKWMSAELLASRAKVYGSHGAVILPPEEEQEVWKTAKKRYEELETAYGPNPERVFLMGDKPVFADLCLAAMLSTVKVVFGEESEEWKDVSGWVGGRVGKLVEEVLNYNRV